MKARRRKLLCFICLFILLISFQFSSYSNSTNVQANPLVGYIWEHNGLFGPSNETHNIDFVDAEVVFDVHTTRLSKYIYYDFTGVYHFYNNNESKSLLIANPFDYENYYGDEDYCNDEFCYSDFYLTANSEQVPLEIRVLSYEESQSFNEYFETEYYTLFLLANITFPEKTLDIRN